MHIKISDINSYLNKRRCILVGLFLVFATFAVYWQVNDFDFVSFDDDTYVVENKHVQEGLKIDGIIWAFGFTDIAYWHPLTWLSHMIDCQLYGLNPGMHHMSGLFFHIANVLLLFLVFTKMTGDFWQSAFIAALFALHPLNVESVAWVAERKNVLSTFFWMLAMLAYAWYSQKPGWFKYILVLIVFSMGLLAKPTLVTLPFVFLLLDFWPLKRLHFEKPYEKIKKFQVSNSKYRSIFLLFIRETPVLRLVLEKVPFFLLSFISILLSSFSAGHHGIIVSLEAVPMKLRIANALVSYMSYLGKMICPTNLAAYYPYPEKLPVWLIIGAGLWLICITVLMLRAIKKWPFLVVGWLWYIGTLIPSIGLMQAGLWPAIADRWTYVPHIGLFIIAGWGIPNLLNNWRFKKYILATVAMVLLVLLTVTTFLQIRYWTNSLTLYKRAVDVTTDNAVMHNNVGGTLYLDGKIIDAVNHFIESLRIDPDYPAANKNLRTAYKYYGKVFNIDEKIRKFQNQYPEDFKLHYALGNMYKSNNKLEKAIEQYKKALAVQPDFILALNEIAVVYMTMEEYKKAFPLFLKISELQPSNILIYYKIACLNALQNKPQESVEWLKKAIARGFKNWVLLKTDKNLIKIRRSKYYKDLIKNYSL